MNISVKCIASIAKKWKIMEPNTTENLNQKW